eukprot:344807-Hanusia_phi.AAC.22
MQVVSSPFCSCPLWELSNDLQFAASEGVNAVVSGSMRAPYAQRESTNELKVLKIKSIPVPSVALAYGILEIR